ncbi:MAG: hypothetical protein HY553_03205 [Elusimicrobia bacterium]|nr:hypothetical protein [Elusimicrobiota bacterium]
MKTQRGARHRVALFVALLLARGAAAQEGDPGPADAGLGTKTAASTAPGPKPDPLNLPGMAPMRQQVKRQAKSAPGIYPVYDLPQGWLLFDRGGKPKAIGAGTPFVVVGSKATGVLTVSGTASVDAACVKGKPGKANAYVLGGRGADALGTPIIALRIPKGQRVDTRAAKLYRLVNEVSDETYTRYGQALKESIIEDVKSGAFLFKVDDSLGEVYARNPDPEKIQLKIDFGSKVRIGGVRHALVLVEGANISRTFRRCVRLFADDAAVGECADMPSDLMTETQTLEFVAYDPSGRGQPFMLAYTTREPLWGHERWGYRLSKGGAKRFLMDALDPKCRERF